MSDISNTDKGKIILGAISAAEDEWRSKIREFIATQIPSIPILERASLILHLQKSASFVEIGKLIHYTSASARNKFNRAVWRINRLVWVKLYKSDRVVCNFIFNDVLALMEDIRVAVSTATIPDIPTPDVPFEERCRKVREAQRVGRLRRDEEAALQKKWAAREAEARIEMVEKQVEKQVKKHLYGKIQKANYAGYRIIYK